MSDTAVVGLVGIAATAFIGIFGAMYSARTQLGLAREERQQSRRADAYVALLDFIIRETTRAGLTMPQLSTGHEEEMMPSQLEEDQWWSMHARVRAFASNRVRALFDDLLIVRAGFNISAAAVNEARGWVVAGDPTTMQPVIEARKRLEEERAAIGDRVEKIIGAVNEELTPAEPPAGRVRRSAHWIARGMRNL